MVWAPGSYMQGRAYTPAPAPTFAHACAHLHITFSVEKVGQYGHFHGGKKGCIGRYCGDQGLHARGLCVDPAQGVGDRPQSVCAGACRPAWCAELLLCVRAWKGHRHASKIIRLSRWAWVSPMGADWFCCPNDRSSFGKMPCQLCSMQWWIVSIAFTTPIPASL